MRKCLGVVGGLALLCVLSWAQGQAPASAPAPASDSAQAPASTPAQAPSSQQGPSTSAPGERPGKGPKYPRLELFGGYSFAQAGFFNAGNWAQLHGWDASLGLNGASWLGFVVEGGEFFGTSKIPTAVPKPFPPCLGNTCPFPTFNVKTREYNILFGAQFPYRKYQRWTPFGELMFGHGGVRGEATLDTFDREVSSGLVLLGGGGADYKISQRFAVRIKADYLQTRTSFPTIGKAKQDNLRLSVGIVIRSVHKKKRTLEEETPPEP